MESFQKGMFSQGGDLSQLTGGFPQERDSTTNEEREDNLHLPEAPERTDESLSSRAEAICEENRQINRFVELSLKQLEKKRINLINKEKSLNEEKANLLETHERQSEQNVALQMSIEEWSLKYENELKKRHNVVDKLKQVEGFISKYKQHFAMGVNVGKSIEDSVQFFQTEFSNIKEKTKVIRDNATRMQTSSITGLEEKAYKCKDMKEAMMKDRESMLGEIQTLAFQTEENLCTINALQENIEKAVQNKEARTQSYNSVLLDHQRLNESISKLRHELNEAKTVNASRVQHLILQLNTDDNIKSNLETKLKEKEESMNAATAKMKELTYLSNQIKEAVDEAKNRVEKKVKEIQLYKTKKPDLSGQVSSLVETLKTYENIESEKESYKACISSLENEVKSQTNMLSKKESNLFELSNELKEWEDKCSKSKEANVELSKRIDSLREAERKLIGTIKEDKMKYQQEREKQLEQNEILVQTNLELASKIADITMKLEELHKLNENAKPKEEEMRKLIESLKERVRINEERFLTYEEEQIKLVENFTEKINEMKNYLERNEDFIAEARPKQIELSETLKQKASLEHEINVLTENHQKKMNSLQNKHKAKIQEMDSEMEKHSSIMKNIESGQEQSTNKLKEEIKEEEKTKIDLENELRIRNQKLKSLKNEELMKRTKIAKMEKRQQKIMNEIKVTREDIAQAVTGRPQISQQVPFKRTRLMTPSSSAGSINSLHGKVAKTAEGKENRTIIVPHVQDTKQESTRKWIESVPEDEYDFSEI